MTKIYFLCCFYFQVFIYAYSSLHMVGSSVEVDDKSDFAGIVITCSVLVCNASDPCNE